MDTQRPSVFPVLLATVILWLAAMPALSGCCIAAAGPAPRDARALLAGPLESAYYRDGQLVLQFDHEGDKAFLAAGWRTNDAGPEQYGFATAVLELADQPPASAAVMLRDWQRVILYGQERWQALVNELLPQLAAESPAAVTLVSVYQTELVLHRAGGGELCVYRLEDKPAGLKTGQRVSEEAFSAKANAYLENELSGDARPGGPIIFALGDEQSSGAFVLFDLTHRQSVFIAHPPSHAPRSKNLGFSLRLFDAVALRSHAISALKNPVTMAHRLVWRTAHAGTAMLPRGTSGKQQAPMLGNEEPMDPSRWETRLDALAGAELYRGQMQLLIDGEAFFESLIQAIEQAQKSVDVRLYIFDRDDYALRIADLLRKRSHEIKVRVLVDRLGTLTAGRVPRNAPYHSRAEPQVFITDYLRQDSKVKVRAVDNPWFTSDHTKTIIIDGRTAYVGGMNIAREYRYEWHDLMVEVSGPIVGRLRKDFDKRWAHTGAGGDLAFFIATLKKERHADVVDGPNFMDIRPLYTRTGDAEILRAQLAAIRTARSRIYVQQPYVSDDQIVAELIHARRRGVDVRIILPTRCDFGLMDRVNLVAARALVNNGVRVYAYPGMTHVKAALYDGWAVVGSANFDKLSLRINQETNLATSDPRFVAQLEVELFDADFARSTELTEIEPLGWRAYVAKLIAEQM
jgi:cardiolipin synthase A/B